MSTQNIFTLLYFLSLFFPLLGLSQTSNKAVWKNKQFALYKDSIVQQNIFSAKAVSSTELISNYRSPANEFLSPRISFKFSINGKDNEMKPFVDHHFTCLPGKTFYETPLILFGTPLIDSTIVPENSYLKPGSKLTIRLDVRQIKKEFVEKGFFTTYSGEKIFKEDFKGIYIAGGTAPLMWDFDNLVNRPELKLHETSQDGIYEVTLSLGERQQEKQIASRWKLQKNISSYPQYHSEYAIADALYNLTLEEMVNAVEADGTFRTGKEWAGVWTRDISYSIILSMAYMLPDVARTSLLKKVKNGKIIQDTGTGGAYPVSTDRMIWAMAAWELYKATGDREWLTQAYTIIKNSVSDDEQNAYDSSTGLVKGESSFLDWREQTYPKWMQPADIFESECLGTNAVHCQANIVLAEMAEILGDRQSAHFRENAQKIKDGINTHLWIPDKGYYGQYLYGRNYKILSPRSEALGEALSVIFGIAEPDRQRQIVQKTPVTDFGISCIYPQIPGIPPYHNNAVWPFVESYWALAAAKTVNEPSLMKSIGAIYRPAALFLTNKENLVAGNGDYAGTQINSSNMLWSLSGNIALIHKIIFGIELKSDHLEFHPFVPYALRGKRSLDNFKYRNSILNIELNGYGNQIKKFLVDGKESQPIISATMTGTHMITIVLSDKKVSDSPINERENYFTPPTPLVERSGNILTWQSINDAAQYRIVRNGKEIHTTTDLHYAVSENTAEYQVIAVDKKGFSSFASEPILVTVNNGISKIEIEDSLTKSPKLYQGFSGTGFVETNTKENRSITIPLTIETDGLYSVDFRYANGNGPTNTDNKCAVRTVRCDDAKIGTVVLPQRGTDEWSNWGYSNNILARLTKGTHRLTIALESANENMNGEINQAMLDHVRIVKIE